MGRNPSAEVNQQQQMMMRIGPLLYVFFAFVSPAAIGIYFLVSTLWRVGQQAFITRSLYSGEDSVGRPGAEGHGRDAGGQEEGRQPEAKGAAGQGRRQAVAKPVDKGTAAKPQRQRCPSGPTPQGRRQTATSRRAAAPGHRRAPKPHPRSRKKKKRK